MNGLRWTIMGLMATACALCLSGSRTFAAETGVIARWTMGPSADGETIWQTVYSDGRYLWDESSVERPGRTPRQRDRQGLMLSRIGCVRAVVHDHPRSIVLYAKTIGGAVEYDRSGRLHNPDALTIVGELSASLQQRILQYPPVASKLNACTSRVDLYGLHFIAPSPESRIVAQYAAEDSVTRFLSDSHTLFLRTHEAGLDRISEVALANIACVYRGGNFIYIWPRRETDVLEQNSNESKVRVGMLLQAALPGDRIAERVWKALTQALPMLASKSSRKKCIVVSYS